MNEAGVSAIVGAFASAICLATTQAAAKYNLPHVVDVGVADQIVERGLKNTFRFGPGYKKSTEVAMANLLVLNKAAGNPAKTVMIIHEESLFGAGTAQLLSRELPGYGFEVKEVVKHANPTRDFNNIVLRMKSLNPDIVIPANYYNEYALLVRTMQQQKVAPKAIFSVLGGAASSYKFVKEFPDAANGIIDCNHWFNPKDKRSQELRKRVEAKGQFFSYEVFMTYTAMWLLADALERAKSTDRAAIVDALEKSTFSQPHHAVRPHEVRQRPERGAQPLMTQVVKNDIKVIIPRDYREVEPVFPEGVEDGARLVLFLALGESACRDAWPCSISASSFPSVLNGLTTGAVYALIALGLTLIYGVLHIINFAHGASLMLALYAVYFLKERLGIDPYLALPIVVLGMFALGYALQRVVINRAGHGKDENILLATLGIAIVMENLALLFFKSDTRNIDTAYSLSHRRHRPRDDRRAQARRLRGCAGGLGASCSGSWAAPTSAARSAPSPRRRRAPS